VMAHHLVWVLIVFAALIALGVSRRMFRGARAVPETEPPEAAQD